MAEETTKEEEKKKKTKTELAIEKLNKDFGKGTVIKIGDHPETKEIEVIPTGSIGLDIATGVGGYPRGRIVEDFGWESSGKTTKALHAIAETQMMGLKAAIVDAEHAFDAVYAAKIGVDVDALYICQPSSGEEGLQVVVALAETGEFGIIVVDSVAALVPKKELEGDMGTSTIGIQSRMMGQAMRKIVAIADKSNTLIYFINQLREKIGVMFGSPETTSGGNALKFYASQRFRVGKSVEKENEANTANIEVVKNKVAAPFGKAKVRITWGIGFDKIHELLEFAIEMKIVEKSGSWYSYGKDQLGQGIEAVREVFESNPEFAKEIENKVRQKIKDGYERPPEAKKEKGS